MKPTSGICVDGKVKLENAVGITLGVPASKEIVPKLLGVYFVTVAPLNLKIMLIQKWDII